MKLYKPNRSKRRIDSRVGLQVSDRDAIVWSINAVDHYALIRIQGSNTDIKAHFPRNTHYTPNWLRPGNSVQIRHRQGNRGYIEIVGPGRSIPTPVSGDSLPVINLGDDCIINGLQIRQTDPASCAVRVTSGQFRVDGEIYTYIEGSSISIDPLTDFAANWWNRAGFIRRDLITVDLDSVVHWIKGTEEDFTTFTGLGLWENGPLEPECPADNIVLGSIYVLSAMGGAYSPQTFVITNKDLAFVWESRKPGSIHGWSQSSIHAGLDPMTGDFSHQCNLLNPVALNDGIVIGMGQSSAHPDNPTCTLVLGVFDQYGLFYDPSWGAYQPTIKLTVLSGDIIVSANPYGESFNSSQVNLPKSIDVPSNNAEYSGDSGYNNKFGNVGLAMADEFFEFVPPGESGVPPFKFKEGIQGINPAIQVEVIGYPSTAKGLCTQIYRRSGYTISYTTTSSSTTTTTTTTE
jgi:hypothetical protein